MPPLDVGDARSFLAAAITIVSEYPPQVMDELPLLVAQRSDKPTLRLIRDVCDEIYRPIGRRLAQERYRVLLAELTPPPKRTPEEQARIDAQVADWRARTGRKP